MKRAEELASQRPGTGSHQQVGRVLLDL